MSLKVVKDENGLSASKVDVVKKHAKRKSKTNSSISAVSAITKEAEKAGYGLSYGKYVQKNNL